MGRSLAADTMDGGQVRVGDRWGRMDPPAPTLFALLITPLTILQYQYSSSHKTTIPARPPTGILTNTTHSRSHQKSPNTPPSNHNSHIKRRQKPSTVYKISIRVNVCKRVVYKRYSCREGVYIMKTVGSPVQKARQESFELQREQ